MTVALRRDLGRHITFNKDIDFSKKISDLSSIYRRFYAISTDYLEKSMIYCLLLIYC